MGGVVWGARTVTQQKKTAVFRVIGARWEKDPYTHEPIRYHATIRNYTVKTVRASIETLEAKVLRACLIDGFMPIRVRFLGYLEDMEGGER